jgi:prepilin-type processing-associated H-X9-DG protein
MFCRNCGKPVADEAVACALCGCSPGTGTKFCAKCGTPGSPAARFCTLCGAALPAPAQADVPAQERKTSGMAIAALVLAIVPTCIGQLVAIGLAIGALVAISRPANKLKGQGIAIAGLVIACSAVFMVPIMAGMTLPALARAREEARKANCKENLAQIGKAMCAFNENNGKFPSSLEVLYPDYLNTFKIFRCPSTEDEPPKHFSYEYRQPAANASADTPVLWDNLENHEGGRNVLFVDGHASWLSEEDFQSLLNRQKIAPAAANVP